MDNWQTILRIATGVLRRRKRLAVVTALLALAALLPAAHYLSQERPRFAAVATIYVEPRPSTVPVFDDLSPSRPLSLQHAILNSRTLAQNVLDALPPLSLQDLQQSLYASNPLDRIVNGIQSLTEREPPTPGDPRARMLSELRGRVKFATKPDGIATITAEASTPQVAVETTNTYVSVLLARTRSFNQDDARISREFLEQQLADVTKNLREGEQRLQRLVESHGGIAVPDRSRAAVADLADAERALAEMETNRKMVEARLQALREKAETQKRAAAARPTVQAAPPSPAPEVQRLRGQLARLETTLLELRERYTDEHPRVVVTRERLAEYHRELALVVKDKAPASHALTAVPPAERVDFSHQLVALETALHTLTAQEEALRNQTARLRKNLTGLSHSELDYSRIVREVESARHVVRLLSDKLTAARIHERGEMKVVEVIDPADRAHAATGGKRIAFLLLAVVGALVAGGGVPAAVEWTRRTVESEDDVIAATGSPVLASVPRLRSRRPVFVNDVHKSTGRLTPEFAFTDAFHALRVGVQFAMRSDNIRTLLVTSPLPTEGKSTVVLNLAHAFREAGQTVVVADTDFHRPTLHRGLDNVPSSGFLDALESDSVPLEESIVSVDHDLWLVPRGASITPRSREALTDDRVKTLLARISTRAKLVICDSSPVLLVPESLFLASAVDGVLLVAKAGVTGRQDLARAKTMLENTGARVIGVVLNELPLPLLGRYYDRYYTRTPRNGRDA